MPTEAQRKEQLIAALDQISALETDLRWTGNAPNKIRPQLGNLVDLKIRFHAARDALAQFVTQPLKGADVGPVNEALEAIGPPLYRLINLGLPLANVPEEHDEHIMPMIREFAVPVVAANTALRQALEQIAP